MSDEHLHPDVIAQVATGQLRGSERAQALAHVDACAACRDDLTYVVKFERRRRHRRLSVIAGVAGILVLAIIVVPRTAPPPLGPSDERTGAEGILRVDSYAPSNGTEIQGDSILFAWQNMGPNTLYRFGVSTATGAPVLDRALRDTTMYLVVAPTLERGEAYFWFIDAVMADGSAARSNVWRFTVPE